ncbi:hypothetical protein C8R45DRAFT_981144 [Mycena sanguinolenta]|nr:hypothetical protein C8R45DRAFT_981144 [Mycena sanguinolenta]
MSPLLIFLLLPRLFCSYQTNSDSIHSDDCSQAELDSKRWVPGLSPHPSSSILLCFRIHYTYGQLFCVIGWREYE